MKNFGWIIVGAIFAVMWYFGFALGNTLWNSGESTNAETNTPYEATTTIVEEYAPDNRVELAVAEPEQFALQKMVDLTESFEDWQQIFSATAGR